MQRTIYYLFIKLQTSPCRRHHCFTALSSWHLHNTFPHAILTAIEMNLQKNYPPSEKISQIQEIDYKQEYTNKKTYSVITEIKQLHE